MSSPDWKYPAKWRRDCVARLSDAQIRELASYLHAPERPPSTMPIDAAHGAICAAATSPFTIPWAKLSSTILGEGHVFASAAEERDITSLLIQLYESTEQELQRGPRLGIVANDRSDGAGLHDWAEGYLVGVALCDPPWHQLTLAEGDFALIIFPFFVLAGRQDEIDAEAGLPRRSLQQASKLLEDVTAFIGTHLVWTYDYWAKARRTADVRSLH